jgi:peroxiredoxin
MDPIAVGEKAPRFHMPATNARILDTRDYQGKKNLVLVFCPPADSSKENTAYLGRVRERAEEIKATDTEIIGISPSNQRFQSIFVYRENLPFPFLIDEAKGCAEDFHALAEDGSVAPTTYVVDKEYVIRLAERGFPDPGMILEALEGTPGD